MYLLFYRNIKLEKVLSFVLDKARYIPQKTHKAIPQSYFEQAVLAV